MKQYSAGGASAGGDGKPFPGQGNSLGGGTPVPTEVPPAEANYLKWLVLAAVVGYWFYSARSKAQQA